MKTLTVKQLIKACENNKYIACRKLNNQLIGVNCKIVYLKSIRQKNENSLQNLTNYISFKPINFSEYIRLKTPFI